MEKPDAPSEEALLEHEPEMLVLSLFVAGFSPRSLRTIDALREICEGRLGGKYQLQIIDIFQQPELARQFQIIATPTLLRKNPLPQKMLIGDLSRIDRLLIGLGISA